ncbi:MULTISPECIES: hypothetical protein [Gordonia]|uniref:hypothetical protein n=1 Tax=Gordonia TaxID=2053 RepID=UPI001F2B8981|nr:MULTISPECIES: hypothetical protein [Gordonia]MCZ0913065.1 hypothetical protein [Gordonia amicalis]
MGDLAGDANDQPGGVAYVLMRSGDVVRILRGEHPQRLEHLGPRADESELEMIERRDGAGSDVFGLHLSLFEG